jgi:pimeloyl-ACP methyl ester carboxylesterase
MKYASAVLAAAVAMVGNAHAMAPAGAPAAPGGPAAQASGPPLKTIFLPLPGQANAIVVEPVTPNANSRIAVLITHPERANNFNYFIGHELPKYGYRALMLNYYGREESYYEFLQPIANAIKALRAMGVEKVVLAGHSSGGAELSSYQDVAENGPAACQAAVRIYKCQSTANNNLNELPKADGLMLIDANTGAPEKTLALNPAVNERNPRQIDPALDIYAARNGYDAASRSASYGKEFLDKYFAAQGAKANRVIDAAQERLVYIEKGEGEFPDDEPFVVAGAAINNAGVRPELADIRLMSRTRAAHPVLRTDGTTRVQVVQQTRRPEGQPYRSTLGQTTMNTTVRHYLSFQALRVTPDYRMTEDNVIGMQWRSTANSVQGNVEGIRVPTLILGATCATEFVLLEIAYDRSAAKDKEYVGVEGADHNFRPCKPEYGDTYKRAFDYMDGWLSKPGRFL